MVLRPQPPSRAYSRPTVITLPLEIDIANARYAGEQLAAACFPGAGMVIADLSLTRFCDSSGVGMLAEAQRHAHQSGTDLRLVVPSTAVLRVLALTGLDQSLLIYPTLADALTPGPAPRAPQR